MWNGVKSKLNRKPFKDFGKFAGSTFGGMVIIPYIIPTGVREIKDTDGDTSQISLVGKIGGWTGIIGGIAADVGQVLGYGYAVKEDHPEFLLIPVAMNVASGVYEIGRKMYNDARQKVLEKYKSEDLESTIKKE